jgi:hypothetical protein
MTNLPKSLRDAMEKEFKWRWVNGDPEILKDSSFDEAMIWWMAGPQWLYEHLRSQVLEFDLEAFHRWLTWDKMLGDPTPEEIARHQHAQTSAIYKIREARRDEEIEELKAELAQRDEEIEKYRDGYRQLKEDAESWRRNFVTLKEAAEQEIERLKAEYEALRVEAKYGPSRNKLFEWSNENKKLAARVVELRESLLKYGCHSLECITSHTNDIEDCTCGFTKALRGGAIQIITDANVPPNEVHLRDPETGAVLVKITNVRSEK